MFLHTHTRPYTRTWPNLVTWVRGGGHKLALGPRRRCHSPERTRGKRGSHGKQRKLLNLRNCSSFFSVWLANNKMVAKADAGCLVAKTFATPNSIPSINERHTKKIKRIPHSLSFCKKNPHSKIQANSRHCKHYRNAWQPGTIDNRRKLYAFSMILRGLFGLLRQQIRQENFSCQQFVYFLTTYY